MSVHFSTTASGPAAGALYPSAATDAPGCHRSRSLDDASPRREAARADDAEHGRHRRAGAGLAEALRAALEAYAGGASSSSASAAGAATPEGATAAVPDAATTSATAGTTQPGTTQGVDDPAAAPRAGLDREALRDFTHALLDALRESGAREVGHGPGRHLQRGHAWGRGGDLAPRLEALAQQLAGGAPATAAPGGTPSPAGSTASPSPAAASAAPDTGASIASAATNDPSSTTAASDTPPPPLPTAGTDLDAPSTGGLRSPLPSSVEAVGVSTSAPVVTPDAATAAPGTSGAERPTRALSALENAFAALWDALPSSAGGARPDARDALAGFLHALAAGLGGAPTYGSASPYGQRATAGLLLQARA
jgi:hypothetical protein